MSDQGTNVVDCKTDLSIMQFIFRRVRMICADKGFDNKNLMNFLTSEGYHPDRYGDCMFLAARAYFVDYSYNLDRHFCRLANDDSYSERYDLDKPLFLDSHITSCNVSSTFSLEPKSYKHLVAIRVFAAHYELMAAHVRPSMRGEYERQLRKYIQDDPVLVIPNVRFSILPQ